MRRLDYREMGQRVRSLRTGFGLTQEQLAASIDVSTSFIGHIERGEKQCSLDTMFRLAVYLQTTIDYLAMGRQNLCDRQSCSLFNDLRKLLNTYGEDYNTASSSE